MTWDTQLGLRVLKGAEAEFYLATLQDAVDYLQEMEEHDMSSDVLTGDRIFDSASFNQKIVLLHQCLSALLDPEIPPPQLTNLLEAAAFFPFAFLELRVMDEAEEETILIRNGEAVDSEDAFLYQYRKLVWNAYDALILSKQQKPDEDSDVGDNELSSLGWRSTNARDWKDAIEDLADRIFYDRDWQVTAQHPQLLDGLEEDFSQQTGISENYITNRLPKVSTEQVAAALSAIQAWDLVR